MSRRQETPGRLPQAPSTGQGFPHTQLPGYPGTSASLFPEGDTFQMKPEAFKPLAKRRGDAGRSVDG